MKSWSEFEENWKGYGIGIPSSWLDPESVKGSPLDRSLDCYRLVADLRMVWIKYWPLLLIILFLLNPFIKSRERGRVTPRIHFWFCCKRKIRLGIIRYII